MLRTLTGAALLCVAPLSACQSTDDELPRPAGPVSPRPPGASGALEATDAAAEAIRCIERGELARARDLLDRLLLGDLLERARAVLADGEPEDALIAIDEALRLAPASPEARLMKADASLRLAEAKIAGGGGSAGLIEGALGDALDYYRSAGESAHARYGASRAAWLLGRTDEALEHARRAVALEEEVGGEADLVALGVPPERIHAEPAYAAYATARSEAREEARELFLESEDALARMIGRASDDPWAWSRLSDLYEWEGQLAEAKSVLERGLERIPEDTGMIERLARVSRALEGPAATVQTFEAYVAAHPGVTAGRWQLAIARFDLALQGYLSDPKVLEPERFAAAEAEFRALRERFPELAQAALGYEVVCRLARGWCAFHAGDLALATREFLSMNELFERGVEWSLPGQLQSGIQGLFFVADAHGAAGANLEAGETFEILHGLQPDTYLWANNAGFFLRDAAFALEHEGWRLCRAARGLVTNADELAELRGLAGIAAGTADESAAFARAASERAAHAREIMERSWAAYRPAAELAPDDVRVVNDAALVLVYYLHRELDLAESWLRRCIEIGGPQVAAKQAELALEESPERARALEDELALLTEAWGDAYQNLGVLLWVHRRDPAAEGHFEKSLEIWPNRGPVRNLYLPWVRGQLVPDWNQIPDPLAWATPCELR